MNTILSADESFKQEGFRCRDLSRVLDAASADLDEPQLVYHSRERRLHGSENSRTRTLSLSPERKVQANRLGSQVFSEKCLVDNTSSVLPPATGAASCKDNATLSERSNDENETAISDRLFETHNGKESIAKQDLCMEVCSISNHDASAKDQDSDEKSLQLQNSFTVNQIATDGHNIFKDNHRSYHDCIDEVEAASHVVKSNSAVLWSNHSSQVVLPSADTQSGTSGAFLPSKDNRVARNSSQPISISPAACSPAINRPSTTGIQIDSTIQTVVQRDPYRNARRVAESIYVFPASGTEIPVEHRNGFAIIAHELRQNLEKYKAPLFIDPRVDIDLFMVGFSRDDVKPSIVITCDEDMVPHVETTLYLDHIQSQHNLTMLKKSSWRNSRKWQPPKNCVGIGPPYQLCVRARDIERVEFGAKIFQSFVGFEDGINDLLWCGSKIVQTPTSSLATLSCILDIGGTAYGLTTAHGFRPDIDISGRLEESWQFAKDNDELCVLLIPQFDMSKIKIPDLDWALIRIPGRSDMPSSLSTIHLGSVAYSHPLEERDILVLSSVHNMPQRGVLLCGTTISGANFDAADVEHWTIELKNENALRKGDSGSLVIDAVTKDIYGHIVARNSYGFVEVMPMHAVLQQIQNLIGGTNVSILQDFETLIYGDAKAKSPELHTMTKTPGGERRTKGQAQSPHSKSKGKATSRISRACDRCMHRKLACDEYELSCQQCLKANTWCTSTDNLARIPVYRGQFAYLERTVEDQRRKNQELLKRLRDLGQDVSDLEYQDGEDMRYEAWKQARSIDTHQPWDREDQQATLSIERILQDSSDSPTHDLQVSILENKGQKKEQTSQRLEPVDLGTWERLAFVNLPQEHAKFLSSN